MVDFIPSENCYNIIKKYEGLRLKPYRCPAGYLTVGYGHRISALENECISESMAIELLIKDVEEASNQVNQLFSARGVSNITQGNFDALVSFTFNLGIGNLRSSTLFRYLVEGDMERTAKEFSRWVYSDGERLEGLVNRRFDEQLLFKSK